MELAKLQDGHGAVNERYLDTVRYRRDITNKTNSDGSANPNYAEISAEFDRLSALFKEQRDTIAAMENLGYRRNQRAGISAVSGLPVKELRGFMRKSDTGKWLVWSWNESIDLVQNGVGLEEVAVLNLVIDGPVEELADDGIA